MASVLIPAWLSPKQRDAILALYRAEARPGGINAAGLRGYRVCPGADRVMFEALSPSIVSILPGPATSFLPKRDLGPAPDPASRRQRVYALTAYGAHVARALADQIEPVR